jgi:hypothetical protein
MFFEVEIRILRTGPNSKLYILYIEFGKWRRNNPGCFDEMGGCYERWWLRLESWVVVKNHVVACALSWRTCPTKATSNTLRYTWLFLVH